MPAFTDDMSAPFCKLQSMFAHRFAAAHDTVCARQQKELKNRQGQDHHDFRGRFHQALVELLGSDVVSRVPGFEALGVVSLQTCHDMCKLLADLAVQVGPLQSLRCTR